jgi:hypothetical protein
VTVFFLALFLSGTALAKPIAASPSYSQVIRAKMMACNTFMVLSGIPRTEKNWFICMHRLKATI